MRAWSVGCLVALGACVTAPSPPPSPPRQTNMALQIAGLVLPNGLRVVHVQDPRAAEIEVTMRYQVGSVDDPPDQAGIAHLVEHLMFQQILGGQSLFAHVEDVTTFFNAETTLDATTYVTRAAPAHLDELLSIEAVRLGFRCTTLSDAAFERERAVVVNELRQRDEATEIFAAIDEGLYPEGHPYRRPVGGSEASVGAITRAQACAFADAHYGPANAVLVVSGDVSKAQLETAIGKFIGRIARRPVTAPLAVAQLEAVARHVDVRAPLDDAALLVAWPLPRDPALRAKVREIAPATASLVDGQIKGSVMMVELGGERAPMIGVMAFPSAGETLDDVVRGAERGIASVPTTFAALGRGGLDELVFDRIQQTALYGLFAGLEEGGNRDTKLATYLIAGQDPSAALAAEFRGLREMTREDAAAIARENLSFDRATIVRLVPNIQPKRGHAATLTAAIHDLGRRRDPPDPARAHQPATGDVGSHGLDGIRTRVLPNGLKIVLLPVTSVPTIDMRLVFDAGTADEPVAKRGVAALAAAALSWDFHYLNDLILFAAAGGTSEVAVETDQTAFAARGLDMHLDLLLAGLRRRVREGTYERDASATIAVMRREANKRADDQGALTDAWRAALYGAGHPYTAAGLLRHAGTLVAADAAAFRAAHYTPDNATLVIAGHFDAAVADRWIDYLFADWAGHAEPRSSPRASSQPASIALAAPTAQLGLQIALPAAAGHRAEQLVAAAMLDDLAGDVRHQLGASYGLNAGLSEQRLATNYVLAGWLDATRASDAVELLRARIQALQTDGQAAALAFVTARDRVLVHLASVTGSAARLAAEVVHDVELGRPAMSDLQTAAAVQQLTIEKMAASLAELDLAHAVVLMRGPATAIDDAFKVLGRTPAMIHVDRTGHDNEDPTAPVAPPTGDSSDSLRVADLADALTTQTTRGGLSLVLAPGYSTGSFEGNDASGFTVAGEVGYRFDETTTLALHASVGRLTGTFDLGTIGEIAPKPVPYALVPIDLSIGLHGVFYDRLWGGVLAGIHANHSSGADPGWHEALAFGAEGGVDILKRGANRFGAYLRFDLDVPEAKYVAITLGVAYRR